MSSRTVIKIVFTVGIAIGLALAVAACGGGSTPTSTATTTTTTPAASAPVAATTTPASSAPVTDTEPADAQACTAVKNAYATFQANQNTDNENAFASALIPNASMTQPLFNAFQALEGDVQDAQLGGSTDPSSGADEQAVASGCAAAGVTMPSGFTGDN